MRIKEFKFTCAVDGSGDFTETKSEQIVGRLVAVSVDQGDLDAGSDIVISVVSTVSGADHTVLTLTNNTGDVLHNIMVEGAETDGSASVGGNVHPFIEGKLKIVVDEGGVSKTGTVVAYVDLD